MCAPFLPGPPRTLQEGSWSGSAAAINLFPTPLFVCEFTVGHDVPAELRCTSLVYGLSTPLRPLFPFDFAVILS